VLEAVVVYMTTSSPMPADISPLAPAEFATLFESDSPFDIKKEPAPTLAELLESLRESITSLPPQDTEVLSIAALAASLFITILLPWLGDIVNGVDAESECDKPPLKKPSTKKLFPTPLFKNLSAII
jgi:hypothetical protein